MQCFINLWFKIDNFSVRIIISRSKNERSFFFILCRSYIFFVQIFSIDRSCVFGKIPFTFARIKISFIVFALYFHSCWLHKPKQVNNKWIHSLRPSSRLTLFMQNDILSQIFGNRIWRKSESPLHSRLIISSAISYSK